ncbi:MAG: hypothetical protein PHC98_10000 [Syntrophotalea acetylenica]|jgi:hypothetical protein|uniref:Uncharacterized protein n=1 Tax=Syntrophotalea acetylenica TaxID=29542 RepID=A0A1L3GEG8_SYNAC|nr:hypothetical protein [Syntrophotalea acetylenica]APG24317.1 hypothetical protein A7E75_04165 [Syntrophotalea acetylenica]APG44900.1 hypothetical protein A6070_12800 [Syntrophotalea acetylenica]MDD4457897.1 hypothetical protein [Syntrophotalea acetylenica]MDY0262576.1 hypothetical protein [Syntrophotalea acetylenica]
MEKVIQLTFIQRDTVRSLHPDLWRQCKYLDTGKISRMQYTWRYTTTPQTALALRLMGLCVIDGQDDAAPGS